MNEENKAGQPAISPEVLKNIAEFQQIYEKGTIPEVLSRFKDFYAMYDQSDKDTRIGMIETLNHIQDLCKSIIKAPTLSAG